MKFGEFLKQQRESKAWTQPEAAEVIGIEQSYLSKLENNKAIPSPDIFDRILQGYKFDIKTLGEKLHDSELNKLSDIVLVRDFVTTTRKQSEGMRRRWLLAGLLLVVVGTGLLTQGVMSQRQTQVRYLYESVGVIQQGEPPYIYLEMPTYKRFSFLMELRGQTKEELMAHPLFSRLDYKQVDFSEFQGNFFDEPATDGYRRYHLINTKTLGNDSSSFVGITIGAMLAVGGLCAFFISRRW